MTAPQARTRELSFFCRLLALDQDRAAIWPDSFRPTHFRVCFGLEHLAVRAIERVEEAVTVGLH